VLNARDTSIQKSGRVAAKAAKAAEQHTLRGVNSASKHPVAGRARLLPAGPEAAAAASIWTEHADTTIVPAQNPIFFAVVHLGPVSMGLGHIVVLYCRSFAPYRIR
jgi:hypothetical protein